METVLIIAGFVFIIITLALIGLTSLFMFQIDVSGTDSNRDL